MCGDCRHWFAGDSCPRLRHAENQARAYIAAHSKPGKTLPAKLFDGTGVTSDPCRSFEEQKP